MIANRSGLFTRRGDVQVPLEGVEVEGEVTGGHARVKVRQRYVNREARAVEAVYTFPLPSDATLLAFSMTCADRRLEGVVRSREEAFREYDEAISQGHGAALVDQERPNVFTAQVGNLLPGEETLIELEYVQQLRADEGLLRWSIPTLVAPRYNPGKPHGDRTGHGAEDPTDRVPDADRISPPIGEAPYGLKLDVSFALGADVVVESPSHAVAISAEPGGRIRVRLAAPEVALDRDVVLTARNVEGAPITAVSAHKGSGPGAFALTVVPDLFDGKAGAEPQEVVFLIDTSGSMDGASITEARSALKLCLRHLREGDRFNVIAFESDYAAFSPEPVVFTQKTLEKADRWVDALRADGGTELLEPLVYALQKAPDAVLVLLTDGQVGNEDEILREVLKVRRRARVYSFGIGTNVSDTLLRDLARETQGAVEFIHPGERIDQKVTAQFARAIAPRIDEVSLTFHGVEVQELTPGALAALVDGEPWTVFGRYLREGSGRAELRGIRRRGKLEEPFSIDVPVQLPERADAPWVEKLWARERIRDLERAQLSGRRADANRERIIQLAVEHQVVTQFTSFLVIERRTGARLSSGQPETRVIPVSLPAGWDMFKPQAQPHWVLPMPARARSAAPMAAPVTMVTREVAGSYGAPPEAKALFDEGRAASLDGEFLRAAGAPPPPPPSTFDPVTALLERQQASGLWEPSPRADDVERALSTARALWMLLREGVTTSHPTHGAQVRKAIGALTALLPRVSQQDPEAAEFVLAVAWLVATGPRSRAEVEAALAAGQGLSSLRPSFGDEDALRRRVETLDAQLR